ncbi:MAG TPA: ABC transporter permease [Terriglobales bacterium]|nr:ABC transporter permease [Terriglobales bacterium]
MHALLRDLRLAARMLRKNDGFAVISILTLALGIGANTAIFTVTSALLLRPFPYRDPQQLVSVDARDEGKDFGGTLLRYELLRDHSQSFQSVAAWANDNFNVTGHGEPLQVPVARVTANFFSLLGVQPELGRPFTADEGLPEGKFVVMLSNSFWRSRFGGDRNIIGQTINLDTTPHTIIGVLPAGMQFPFVGEADLWTPRYFELTLMPAQRLRLGVGYLGLVARLRPGTMLARAQAELAVLNRQYRRQNPTAPDAGPEVVMAAEPLRDLVVAGVRSKVLILSAVVALVLLIACANVASLLLARALARKREIALRAALGASRGALVRQLLAESTLLALAGGALGIGLSWLAIRALLAWGAGQLPQGIPIAMDSRVLLFTLLVSLVTGILFGIFPALQLSRAEPSTPLREEGRSSTAGHARVHTTSLLVVGQVALSLLLLIGAGLLLRSFARLLRVEPGFDAHNLLTMNVSLPTVKYAKPEQQVAFFDEVLRRVSILPGVRNAAISAALPLGWKRITPVLPEGQANVPLGERPFIDIEAVSPQWFDTMRAPLLAGRQFTAADNAQAPKVLIVNQTFAHRFWPGQNPVGKRVIVGRWPEAAEVVGVSADVKNRGLAQDTQAQVYIPFAQLPWGNMNLLVRTAVAPLSMAGAVRAQISGVDPDQPVNEIQTANELMKSSLAQPRFTMLLLVAFSATALALAIIGVYGVLAYSVAQRRHELGIRVALGAERADILRLVVRQGLLLAGAGVAVGLFAALLLTRLMSSLLYRIGARDLTTFVLAPVAFLGIALLASYLPALRATRTDPMEALRGS